MIRYPTITGKTEAQKLDQVSSYLHQLADELNYQLEKGGSTQNGNLQTARATAAAIAKPVKNDSAISSFNEIKALIIKSADIVEAYSESIKKSLEGEYVAVSDFGTYTEETQATLEANSKSITTVVEKQEQIESDLGNVEKDLRSEIKQTADSIKLVVTDDTAGKTASIKLSVGEGDDKKEYTGTIDMTGLVTFTNLTDGKTEISGDNITTGQILADLIKAGVLKSKDGESVVIDLDNGAVNLVGVIKSQQEAGKRTMLTPDTVTAQSLYDGLYAHLLPGAVQLQDTLNQFYSNNRPGEWVMTDANDTYKITAKLDKTNQIALLELQGKAGSTLSIFSSNGGANHIRGLSNPIGSTDAATKGYVDTNFAPVGFGLGGKTGEPKTDDLNDATACGWYAFTTVTLNRPFDYGSVCVSNRYGSQITQLAFNPYMAGVGEICVRHYYDGWKEWEYINPPMKTGVEYRTTERWNGKAVYTKLVSFTMPNNQNTNVPGLSPSMTVIDYDVVMVAPGLSMKLPYFDANGVMQARAVCNAHSSVIQVLTKSDLSSYTGYATIKYTKD